MQVIDQSHEIIAGHGDIRNIPRLIEAAGRTCYKSEDKITEDSAIAFCQRLIKNGHEAMLEHNTIILEIFGTGPRRFYLSTPNRKYLNITRRVHSNGAGPKDPDSIVVSGSLRAWRDFFKSHLTCCTHIHEALLTIREHLPDLMYDLPFWTLNTEHRSRILSFDDLNAYEKWHHQVVGVRFITDRGVTHELVRHRPAAFAQESTRYVKYDGGMQFIRPTFEWSEDSHIYKYWECAMAEAEYQYQTLRKYQCPPQEARSVLPNSLKTEIVVTTTLEEWNHIFKLRCAKAAHPQIRSLMIPVLEEFVSIHGLFRHTMQ